MGKESFISPMFEYSQGDLFLGAKYMAEQKITQEIIDLLTHEQIEDAFLEYKQQHMDYGIPFDDDLEEFTLNLLGNINLALRLSKRF